MERHLNKYREVQVDKKCSECENWDVMTEGSEAGLCRLRPPQLITETVMQKDPLDGHDYPALMTRSAWCLTMDEDWCYEGFRSKRQTKVTH